MGVAAVERACPQFRQKPAPSAALRLEANAERFGDLPLTKPVGVQLQRESLIFITMANDGRDLIGSIAWSRHRPLPRNALTARELVLSPVAKRINRHSLGGPLDEAREFDVRAGPNLIGQKRGMDTTPRRGQHIVQVVCRSLKASELAQQPRADHRRQAVNLRLKAIFV